VKVILVSVSNNLYLSPCSLILKVRLVQLMAHYLN